MSSIPIFSPLGMKFQYEKTLRGSKHKTSGERVSLPLVPKHPLINQLMS